jgi:DNA-binding NarL/FixJ family response regulator
LDKLRIIFAASDSDFFVELKSLVQKQPDMSVLHFEGMDGIELLLAVQELEPDVVVLALLENGSEPGICSHLLEEFNGLVVMAISPSKIHRLSKSSVLSFSESALLETIRMAIAIRPVARTVSS